MARRSSVTKLDPRLREAVDALIRDGRATLDEIIEHLAQLNGGESPVSRSALGRYAQQATAQMERYREAQEVAKVWVSKLETEPDGDVGRLLPEMLRSVAFQTLGSLSERDAAADAEEVMLLAKAMKDLASADKLTAERILRVRQEVLKEAASNVETAARSLGMGEDQVKFWRAQVLKVGA